MPISVDRDLEFFPAMKKIEKRIADLEAKIDTADLNLINKIDLAVSNTKHLVEQFDKVIKDIKKVK